MDTNRIIQYNVLNTPWPLADNSIDCCVTSPPYWGLRDYGVAGQLGLEKTPEEYVQKMVFVFEEVKRVLKPCGTLWLNLGDSYAASGRGGGGGSINEHDIGKKITGDNNRRKPVIGLKPKDLVGIPWMVAFALRSAGWYLRSDIIWAKKNCMPESVTDRPTRSHEYIFLLSKSTKYYYDQEAIKEPAIYDVDGTGTAARKARQKEENKSMPTIINGGIRPAGFKDAEKMNGKHGGKGNRKTFRGGGKYTKNQSFDNSQIVENDSHGNAPSLTGMRNKRDVWNVAPAQFPEAHFATFPEELITPCILAGCPKDGIVLDPFIGAGTTALVSLSHGRQFIGFELNPAYITIANKRLKQKFGMFYNEK